MDEVDKDIKREDILRLGGGAVLGAVATLLGSAQASAEEPKTKAPKSRKAPGRLGTMPLGLDFTTAPEPEPCCVRQYTGCNLSWPKATKLMIYADQTMIPCTPAPAFTFQLSTAYLNGGFTLPGGGSFSIPKNNKIPSVLWIAIWT